MAKRTNTGVNSDKVKSSYQKVWRLVAKTPEFKSFMDKFRNMRPVLADVEFSVSGSDSRFEKFVFNTAFGAADYKMYSELIPSTSRNFAREDDLRRIARSVIGVYRNPSDKKPIVPTFFCNRDTLIRDFPDWVKTNAGQLGLTDAENVFNQECARLIAEAKANPGFEEKREDAMREHVQKTIRDVMMRFKDQPEELLEKAVRSFTIAVTHES